VPRLVWNAPGANVLGAPTLDGQLVTCVDPTSGDLAVLETATGKLRRLTSRPPSALKEFASFSVPSRRMTSVESSMPRVAHRVSSAERLTGPPAARRRAT